MPARAVSDRHRGPFDNFPFDLVCPQCGTKHEKTLGWLKRDDQLVCAGCRRTIRSFGDLDALRQHLRQLEELLGQLGWQVGP